MKYIGSKAKFADEIVAILQGYISEYKIKQYVEPFAGGFNVIDKVQCEYRLGNDIDPLVCDLIETCRDNPALLDSLYTPTREEYYDVRDNKGNYAAWYRAAVLFFSSFYSVNTYIFIFALPPPPPPPKRTPPAHLLRRVAAPCPQATGPADEISGTLRLPQRTRYKRSLQSRTAATHLCHPCRIQRASAMAAKNSTRRSFGIGADFRQPRGIL